MGGGERKDLSPPFCYQYTIRICSKTFLRAAYKKIFTHIEKRLQEVYLN